MYDACRYQEKFYFNPGDTGFKVWDTKFGRIGAAICWDQWFPETARCLALMGAEVGLLVREGGCDGANVLVRMGQLGLVADGLSCCCQDNHAMPNNWSQLGGGGGL